MKFFELLRVLKLPIVNILLSRFLPGDYIMIGTFILTWIIPDKMMLLDKNIVNGLSVGMFFQFLFGHASVGLGVAGQISEKRSVTVMALTGFGLFYFIFFAAFAYATGSYLIVAIFIFTFFQNLQMQNTITGDSKKKADRMLQLILIPFISVMILLLSSISLLVPVPKLGFSQIAFDFSEFTVRGEPNHPESIMFWGIIYYIMMIQFKRIWNKFMVKKAGNILPGIE